MKRAAWLGSSLLVLATSPALAQGYGVRGYADPYGQGAPAPGSYGGGLIEALMTGRTPPAGQGRAAAYPTAGYPAGGYAAPSYPAGARPGRVAPSPVAVEPSEPDPFADPAPVRYGARRQQVAALPAGGDDTLPRRTPGPEFQRQTVGYGGGEAAGTIVIDTPSKFLYLVQGNGQALRYGIGVGRPGFAWAGTKTITAKKEWPGWTPPPEMLRRRPDLPRHMEGGPANPLGARAMYLGTSLYRIHGTNEPYTIGQNVSSGCIRMMNEDVTDLYERVRVGTVVKVI